LAAFGFVAFGLAAFGLAAFGFAGRLDSAYSVGHGMAGVVVDRYYHGFDIGCGYVVDD